MSNYSDFVRDRSEEILRRTEMSPEEIAEHAERARRNKIDRIMAAAPPPGATNPLPATVEKRAGEAPGGEYASRKWVRAQLKDVVRGVGAGLAQYTGKRIAPMSAAVEQAQRSLEAHGRVIDRLSNELAELKREGALAKRLADQNVKRKLDLLELENSLLRAGRRPDEAREEAEADLPDFREWPRHAQ